MPPGSAASCRGATCRRPCCRRSLRPCAREPAGRWEAAIEVDPDRRDRGLGRILATAARHLVPDGAPLWAQIAAGSAASVRAFFAAGFAPVGGEALLIPAG